MVSYLTDSANDFKELVTVDKSISLIKEAKSVLLQSIRGISQLRATVHSPDLAPIWPDLHKF